MVPFKDWTKIQGRIGKGNQFYSSISPRSQNPRSSHNVGDIFLKMKHMVHLVLNPQSHQTRAATTTTPKVLNTFIIFLVLVPKKHARPLDLFLTLFAQWKFKRQGSCESIGLIKFYPLLVTITKSKSTTHLLTLLKVHELSFLSSPKFPLVFFSQYHIYSSNLCPFAPQKSSCQSPHKTVIHTTQEESSLSSWDCVPSLKPTHQDPFAITC
jgi:hypothetical protein